RVRARRRALRGPDGGAALRRPERRGRPADGRGGEAGRGLQPARRVRGGAGVGRPVQAVPVGGGGRPAAPRGGGGRGRGRAAGRAAADERARRAELERARAELRVVEQRKRWRVQVLLGLAVALLMLGGGAFAWWRHEKGTQTRAGVRAAVEQAVVLRKQYR